MGRQNKLLAENKGVSVILPELYYKIKSDKDIRRLFEEIFDFIIMEESTSTEDYLFYSREKLTIFATDGAGGVYATVETDDNHDTFIVFISSEGQAGKIARSFNQLINLIIHYPFWSDILKFSGNGRLEEMKKSIKPLEDERVEFIPCYLEVQKTIADKLKITKNKKLIEYLYEVVMEEPKFVVFSTIDNNTSDDLIGSFESNNLKI